MAICRACSSEIIGTDRYCRNCGAPVAPLVAEFDDTRRISPSAPLPSAPPGTPDNTNPLYSPPYAAYSAPQAPEPLSRGALLARLLFRPNLVWALIIAMLFTFVGLGIGRVVRRPYSDRIEAREAQDEVEDEVSRLKYEEVVQNALGFKQGVFSSSDFPDAEGIFVNSLMSDDSAAALAKIQAGDLLMELNDRGTRNDSELSQVLESLSTGDEVPVKVYREGATVNLRIKIAERSH